MRRVLCELLLIPTVAGLLLTGACKQGAQRPAAADGARAAAPQPAAAGDGQWRNDWVEGAVFYQIFVRSFADSNGDGHGDLEGLTAKLDYLNDGKPATASDLGVDALWLMPIHPAPSYHGYDVTDYERVHPDYGTVEDFVHLCREAHRRGMRVVIDFVINHTSDEHPWFRESASSASSPRRDFYVWSKTKLDWVQPWEGGKDPTWHERNGAWYYAAFYSKQPDLNFQSPAVRAEMKRIAALWLDRGVDGFRLDGSRYLIETGPKQQGGQADTKETHAYWREFASFVRARRPDAVLIGENWLPDSRVIASYYGSTRRVRRGDELPLSFNFPLADRIVSGVKSGDAAGIADKLAEVRRVYPTGTLDAPFLTNHDQNRLATEVGNDPAKLRVAAAILLTLPGAPFLYYGEEVGLQNGPPDREDRGKRTPMPWDATPKGGFTRGKPWYALAEGNQTASVAAQTADPGSLLARYRTLIRLRRGSPALSKGAFEPFGARAAGPTPLLAFLRRAADQSALVVHNLGAAPAQLPLALPAGARVGAPLFADAGVKLAAPRAPVVSEADGGSGGGAITLPPHGSAIYAVTFAR